MGNVSKSIQIELPITLEEFGIFVLHDFADVAGEADDNSLIQIKQKINSCYINIEASKVIGKIGVGLLIEWFKSRNLPCSPDRIYHSLELPNALSYAYGRLSTLPKKYISESIGQGLNGICFNLPSGRIKKINYRGDFSEEETMFYEYLMNKNIRIFPRVYALEKNQVVMERLITSHPILEQLRVFIRRYIDSVYSESEYKLSRSVNRELLNYELPKNHWFCKLIKNSDEGLEEIFRTKTIGDFQPSNFGLRDTGEIVYFDPII